MPGLSCVIALSDILRTCADEKQVPCREVPELLYRRDLRLPEMQRYT